jgi:hypothetical protein
MSGCGSIMVGIKQFESQGVVVRNIEPISKIQATLVNTAVGQGYLSGVSRSFCNLAYDASRQGVSHVCLLQGFQEVLGG